MADYTLEQVKQIHKEQNPDILKWKNLEENQVHKIVKCRFITTKKNEEVSIISLKDGRDFWTCSGLYKALKRNSSMPKHVVSEGEKQSKKSDNKYWSFMLIDG